MHTPLVSPRTLCPHWLLCSAPLTRLLAHLSVLSLDLLFPQMPRFRSFGFSLYRTPCTYTTALEYFFLPNYVSYLAFPSEPVLYSLLLDYRSALPADFFFMPPSFPLNLLSHLS